MHTTPFLSSVLLLDLMALSFPPIHLSISFRFPYLSLLRLLSTFQFQCSLLSLFFLISQSTVYLPLILLSFSLYLSVWSVSTDALSMVSNPLNFGHFDSRLLLSAIFYWLKTGDGGSGKALNGFPLFLRKHGRRRLHWSGFLELVSSRSARWKAGAKLRDWQAFELQISGFSLFLRKRGHRRHFHLHRSRSLDLVSSRSASQRESNNPGKSRG